MKYVGRWWSNREIELVEIEGVVYALHGWNGEKYTECWICSGEFFHDSSDETYTLRPVYNQSDDEYEIINYIVDRNY